MLKTSPILVSSANASPTGFCRSLAPARSPPPPGSARISRTASLTASSPTSPPRARPRPKSSSASGPRDAPSPSGPQSVSVAPAPPPSEATLQAQSPNKRRGSPSQGTRHATTSGSDVTAQEHGSSTPGTSSKRPRANEQPPKMLPRRYEHCAAEDMVELIAHMLAELIATNDAIRISSGGLTRFHSR